MKDEEYLQIPTFNHLGVKLYKNLYRSKEGKLVEYQNFHESLEDARKTFVRQHNGDVPVYILEIQGIAYAR